MNLFIGDNVNIANLLTLAFFVEAIISAVKPIWNKNAGMTITEYISIGLGIVLAVILKLDMIGPVTGFVGGNVADIIFEVMTGIAMGRGPSFLFDAWMRIKNQDFSVVVADKEKQPEEVNR